MVTKVIIFEQMENVWVATYCMGNERDVFAKRVIVTSVVWEWEVTHVRVYYPEATCL
jgi:hypothetical protein